MDLVTLTGIIFILLKLSGVISWSWFWVLSPFWSLFLLGVAIGANGDDENE